MISKDYVYDNVYDDNNNIVDYVKVGEMRYDSRTDDYYIHYYR